MAYQEIYLIKNIKFRYNVLKNVGILSSYKVFITYYPDGFDSHKMFLAPQGVDDFNKQEPLWALINQDSNYRGHRNVQTKKLDIEHPFYFTYLFNKYGTHAQSNKNYNNPYLVLDCPLVTMIAQLINDEEVDKIIYDASKPEVIFVK